MEDPNLQRTFELLADYDLSTVERIILSSTDTVQSLLSVIIGAPVRVEVIDQTNEYGVIIRWSKLIADEPDPLTVALAQSVIPLEMNHSGFIGAMGDRDIGIGQAISRLGVFTRRRLRGIHVDRYTFSRIYTIEGASINVTITETFQRNLFNVP